MRTPARSQRVAVAGADRDQPVAVQQHDRAGGLVRWPRSPAVADRLDLGGGDLAPRQVRHGIGGGTQRGGDVAVAGHRVVDRERPHLGAPQRGAVAAARQPPRRGRGRGRGCTCRSSSARRARRSATTGSKASSSMAWTVTARSGISTSSPRRNRLYARSPSMCTALAAGGTWRIAPRKPSSDRRTASSSVVAAVSAQLALRVVGRRRDAEAHGGAVALVEAGQEAPRGASPGRPARSAARSRTGRACRRGRACGRAPAAAPRSPRRRSAGRLVEQQHAGLLRHRRREPPARSGRSARRGRDRSRSRPRGVWPPPPDARAMRDTSTMPSPTASTPCARARRRSRG